MTPNEFQKAQRARILSCYDIPTNDLEKSGEGARGGKVIGHTKSGKPIYEKSTHKEHGDFTSADHADAAELHKKLEGDEKGEASKKKHREEAAYHNSMSAVKNKYTVNMYDNWK